MKIHLLSIDPQNDFCQKQGALYVPGAEEDIKRLTNFVNKMKNKIDDIHVTLDSHLPLHIAHPEMWLDKNNNHPPPFTLITSDDVEKGIWRTRHPLIIDTADGKMPYALYYTRALENNSRYALCIWPPHCLIGSWGACVDDTFHQSLGNWQIDRFKAVNYVTKGSNFRTEHYSAVKADVEDPVDPSTQLNMTLIDILQDPEIKDILITGQALSHCVANTIRDIADNFGEENIKKFVLLEDTSSNVPGFENEGQLFIRELSDRGMRITTTRDYAA